MGRKKKEVKEDNFIPSKYQSAIFDYVEHGNGNLVVEACAGSGKSTTLIQIIKRLPSDKSILFCAFFMRKSFGVYFMFFSPFE